MGTKLTLCLLLTLGLLVDVYAQSKDVTVIEAHLKVVTASEEYFCNNAELKILFSKKRVTMSTAHFSVDISITKRKKNVWQGVDQLGTEYTITAYSNDENFALRISPINDEEAFDYTISQSNDLCL